MIPVMWLAETEFIYHHNLQFILYFTRFALLEWTKIAGALAKRLHSPFTLRPTPFSSVDQVLYWKKGMAKKLLLFNDN